MTVLATNRRDMLAGMGSAALILAQPQSSRGMTVLEQLQQVKETNVATLPLADESSDRGALIARGTISLPLDAPTAAQVDAKAFDNDNAALFITVFGRSGPPIAAVKFRLKALRFPLRFEIRTADLLFPLTAEAWASDSRNGGELGLAASADSDGNDVTATTSDLIGFASSSPLKIGGAMQLSDVKITLAQRVNFNGYTDEQVDLLRRIDAQLSARALRK